MTSFSVSTEQLLLRFDHEMVNLHLRLFEPETPLGTVICFHGYVGNGMDFVPLAEFLAANGYRVVCPDMFGRGASAHFENARRYSMRSIVQGSAAVLARYGDGSTIIGMGWGALVALMGIEVARARVNGLVALDLPLLYSVDADPIIARAAADRGKRFASAEAAIADLLTSPEFAGLASGAGLTHRIRQEGDSFALSHDEGIVARTAEFGGRQFDLRTLIAQANAKPLLLYSDAAPATAGFPATLIGDLTPGGRLRLLTTLEHLLILGFATDGRRPAGPFP